MHGIPDTVHTILEQNLYGIQLMIKSHGQVSF